MEKRKYYILGVPAWITGLLGLSITLAVSGLVWGGRIDERVKNNKEIISNFIKENREDHQDIKEMLIQVIRENKK